jgi:hypothetical protein
MGTGGGMFRAIALTIGFLLAAFMFPSWLYGSFSIGDYYICYDTKSDDHRAKCDLAKNIVSFALAMAILVTIGTVLVVTRPRLATVAFAVATVIGVGMAVALPDFLTLFLLWTVPAALLTGLSAGAAWEQHLT